MEHMSTFRPTSKFYKPMQPTRFIQLFAIHPCNPTNLAESFEIYLTWKIRHIILEIFWPKTSETNYSYYCLSKKLMKSYTEVVNFSKYVWIKLLSENSFTFQIRTKFTWKINRLNSLHSFFFTETLLWHSFFS